MRIDVVGKNIEVTEALRQYAEQKMGKLPKYFDGVQQITVTLHQPSAHKPEFLAEIVVDVEKHNDFVGRATAQDLYAAIDLAEEKAERQLRDFKEQLKQGNR